MIFTHIMLTFVYDHISYICTIIWHKRTNMIPSRWIFAVWVLTASAQNKLTLVLASGIELSLNQLAQSFCLASAISTRMGTEPRLGQWEARKYGWEVLFHRHFPFLRASPEETLLCNAKRQKTKLRTKPTSQRAKPRNRAKTLITVWSLWFNPFPKPWTIKLLEPTHSYCSLSQFGLRFLFSAAQGPKCVIG